MLTITASMPTAENNLIDVFKIPVHLEYNRFSQLQNLIDSGDDETLVHEICDLIESYFGQCQLADQWVCWVYQCQNFGALFSVDYINT